jgi:hypothetical protein
MLMLYIHDTFCIKGEKINLMALVSQQVMATKVPEASCFWGLLDVAPAQVTENKNGELDVHTSSTYFFHSF